MEIGILKRFKNAFFKLKSNFKLKAGSGSKSVLRIIKCSESFCPFIVKTQTQKYFQSINLPKKRQVCQKKAKSMS